MEVKAELKPIVEKNKAQRETQEAYNAWSTNVMGENNTQFLSRIVDIME
jgi:hypothetical protein